MKQRSIERDEIHERTASGKRDNTTPSPNRVGLCSLRTAQTGRSPPCLPSNSIWFPGRPLHQILVPAQSFAVDVLLARAARNPDRVRRSDAAETDGSSLRTHRQQSPQHRRKAADLRHAHTAKNQFVSEGPAVCLFEFLRVNSFSRTPFEAL